ncbi:MAG: hypothetical protein LBR47_07675 [Spirochaetaceae bacterium]|jgi:hypothetical protein|nr:hypothetical protein [Spirochaetaceae bacterium]
MSNTQIEINSIVEIRKEGLKALREALGFAGMVQFIHQYENGEGDYTKEKYEQPDLSLDEIDMMIKSKHQTKK